jgi:hypothetical protein
MTELLQFVERHLDFSFVVVVIVALTICSVARSIAKGVRG